MNARIRSCKELKDLKRSILEQRESEKPVISICASTGCLAFGAEGIIEAFKEGLEREGLEKDVIVKRTGCHGFCERGPLVLIQPKGILYVDCKPENVPEIITRTLVNGEIIEDLIYEDPKTNEKTSCENDIPFYRGQKRLVLKNCGKIDPKSIEDYVGVGGYGALAKALTSLTPDGVIEEVERSGLRGRGGAGFPTGRKWGVVRRQESPVKYIVCNADEGDPGAYMDRSVLESNPHSVIEGMLIGAYAIGANEGWIYLRHEYPLAIEHMNKAIEDANELGLLGENILGTQFDFKIRIAKGAGAFVCGEETALIQSIEGKKGNPKQRPPFPAESGLFGKPTSINNVETWANIPIIVQEGGEWFAQIGSETSKGTKIFSLVGKIQNSGLVEVPMGITISEIVYDIGGGAPNGKEVKAIQIGGPSGGCIPQESFHLPVDYESLTDAGATMGSGGLIVLDEDTCMVDLAKYFTNFLQDESCGKCSICREGTQRMHEILSNITKGNGRIEDLDLLEELGQVIKDTSMCGLGQTAPNPVLSTLRYFREEYISHIEAKECPARHCEALIRYSIVPENCTGCGLCKKNCPEQAISGERKEIHSIDQDACIKCGICFEKCKFNAVFKETGVVENA